MLLLYTVHSAQHVAFRYRYGTIGQTCVFSLSEGTVVVTILADTSHSTINVIPTRSRKYNVPRCPPRFHSTPHHLIHLLFLSQLLWWATQVQNCVL